MANNNSKHPKIPERKKVKRKKPKKEKKPKRGGRQGGSGEGFNLTTEHFPKLGQKVDWRKHRLRNIYNDSNKLTKKYKAALKNADLNITKEISNEKLFRKKEAQYSNDLVDEFLSNLGDNDYDMEWGLTNFKTKNPTSNKAFEWYLHNRDEKSVPLKKLLSIDLRHLKCSELVKYLELIFEVLSPKIINLNDDLSFANHSAVKAHRRTTLTFNKNIGLFDHEFYKWRENNPDEKICHFVINYIKNNNVNHIIFTLNRDVELVEITINNQEFMCDKDGNLVESDVRGEEYGDVTSDNTSYSDNGHGFAGNNSQDKGPISPPPPAAVDSASTPHANSSEWKQPRYSGQHTTHYSPSRTPYHLYLDQYGSPIYTDVYGSPISLDQYGNPIYTDVYGSPIYTGHVGNPHNSYSTYGGAKHAKSILLNYEKLLVGGYKKSKTRPTKKRATKPKKSPKNIKMLVKRT